MRRLAIAVCLLLVVVMAGTAVAALSGSDKKKLQRDVGASLDQNVTDDATRGEARQKFMDFFGKRKAKELADVEGLTEVLANAARKVKRINGETSFDLGQDGEKLNVEVSVPKKYNPSSGPSWPMIFAVPDKGMSAKDYLAKHWGSKAIRETFIIAVVDMDYSEVEVEERENVQEEDSVKVIVKKVKKPFTWEHLRPRGQWWLSLWGLMLEKMKVDPNRVILDGSGIGATGNLNLAIGDSWRFAGIIDRGGEGDDPALTNLATLRFLSLPYAMASEKSLETTARMKKICGDFFTAGTNEPAWSGAADTGTEILAWLKACQRNRYPLPFKWAYTKNVHQVGHWCFITDVHDPELPTSFSMEADKKAGLITIKTENVKEFNLFLNDLLVDLGKKFKVKINDADPVEYDDITRSADRLIEHASTEQGTPGPWDRGCVFTADIDGLRVEAPPAEEEKKDGEKKDDPKKDGEEKGAEKKDGE